MEVWTTESMSGRRPSNAQSFELSVKREQNPRNVNSAFTEDTPWFFRLFSGFKTLLVWMDLLGDFSEGGGRDGNLVEKYVVRILIL